LAHSTAARISRGVASLMALSRSGRFSSRRAMRGLAGSGAMLQWNRNSNVLSWKVTFTGLSGEVTGAHIHGPASPGENAGVVIPFMTGLSGTITGQTNLTSAQALDLAAGRWYVNIHTVAFPGGEIRGQLMPRR
jgi:hypothetical protein